MDTIPFNNKKEMVFEPNAEFTFANIRKNIITTYIRSIGFPNHYDLNQATFMNTCEKITLEIHIPNTLIVSILNQFFSEIERLQQFFATHHIHYTPINRLKKAQYYLYKVYRYIPIFNYTRAVHNLNSLHILFARLNFWPRLTTQMALALYITEYLDKTIPEENKITITNIRSIFSCSAYAFYRTRNKICLNRYLMP